jgi:hypothetical protein
MSVKILYSPGYGAGWVTWASGSHAEKTHMLRYQPFIDEIEEHGSIRESHAESLWEQYAKDSEEAGFGAPYKGGYLALRVYPLSDGEAFRVKEHDGYESVETIGSQYDDIFCFQQ